MSPDGVLTSVSDAKRCEASDAARLPSPSTQDDAMDPDPAMEPKIV